MGLSIRPAIDAKRGYFVSATPLTVEVQSFETMQMSCSLYEDIHVILM